VITAMCLGTNDLAGAGEFYDQVLSTVGMVRLEADDNEVGYGEAGGEVALWVLIPFDGEPATYGNGTQIIFDAPDSATVDSFHKAAMDNGGSDEGAPGPRGYAPGYYGAYCRDRDGNKLHIFTILSS